MVNNHNKEIKTVAVIVAHPDDETLWAGGAILQNPTWDWLIVSLCRANDANRAPKFYKALKLFNAKGIMGNLDDGPAQIPLPEKDVEEWILNLLPTQHFDLIITHNPLGEYTKHLRHEEVSKAVINLWAADKISTDEMWVFAYEDGHKAYLPTAIKDATIFESLIQNIWLKKYSIITETYGFSQDSWEAKTTPKAEAFWQFKHAKDAKEWLDINSVLPENTVTQSVMAQNALKGVVYPQIIDDQYFEREEKLMHL